MSSRKHMYARRGLYVAPITFTAVVIAFMLVRRLPAVQATDASARIHEKYLQAIEEARQAGIPVTPQLLQAPLPPADKNAAPIYTQLTNLLARQPITKKNIIAMESQSQQIPSSNQFEQIRLNLKQRGNLMALIHKAAVRPRCVFVRNWSDPIAIQYRELATIRDAFCLLACESILLAHDGKSLDAVKNQSLGFNLARHIENEDTCIEYLVALGVDAMTLHGFQRILYMCGNTADVADAVKSTIASRFQPGRLASAIQKEAGIYIVTLGILRDRGPSYLDFDDGKKRSGVEPKPNNWRKFVDEAGLVTLRRERKAITAADLPYVRSEPVFRELDAGENNDQDPKHMLAALFSGSFSLAILTRRTATLAIAETTRAAASLLAYKSRHGSFPATLAEALTPVPLDPFDGQPLRYRKEGLGFVVHSIGRNGSYTGGNSNQKPARYEADVTLRYPFPAYLSGPLREN